MSAESNFRDRVRSLGPVSEDCVLAFCHLFQKRSLKKGIDFIREGETGTHIGFVVRGLLRSYYISPRGEELNKHFFLEGTFMGPLTSLVLNRPSPVHIGAMEDSELLVAPYKDVARLYETNPEVNKIGRIIIEYAWIGKERRETQLIMLDATQRYLAFLEEFPKLDMRIPQYHIASYLGITPVQLSRIRSRKLT